MILISVIFVGFSSCGSELKSNPVKEVINPYRLSDNFTEEEYISKVKEIKEENYYSIKKKDYWQWGLLMKRIESFNDLKKNDVIVFFVKDSTILSQELIKDISNDSIFFSFNGEQKHIDFFRDSVFQNKGVTFNYSFFRKKGSVTSPK